MERQRRGQPVCWEALTLGKCFCFAGSDVLQWIVQRLWVSSLGEDTASAHLSGTSVCARHHEGISAGSKLKGGFARVSEKLTVSRERQGLHV